MQESGLIKIDDISAYLAKPESEAKGGIIVIHEVWGLTDHIKDVADRLAKEGYVALAPDLLSDAIDTGKISGMQEDLFNPERRNAIQPKLREIMTPLHDPDFGKKAMARLKSCFDHLRSQVTDPNIAVIGFCFGGTYSFSLAVKEPELKLAMPFYGHANQSAQELEAIGCPVRAFYGENDENLMKDLPDLKDRMDQAGVDFQATVYPDCGHAFFNDTNRFAYNEPAADDAWQKVLENLRSYL